MDYLRYLYDIFMLYLWLLVKHIFKNQHILNKNATKSIGYFCGKVLEKPTIYRA
jgi:hypothetical protein